MIHANALSKRFGPLTAVRDAAFRVERGTLAAFLGPNGAGKTTTIRMLAGFIAPSSGSASIAGFDTMRDSLAARARLGLLHEHNPLYPEMRVRDYLGYRAGIHRIPRPSRRASIDRAMQRCQLADVAHRRIGALSKGYRQRVGLAASILHDPPALILDEPTSGLDPSQAVETRSLLRELSQDHAVLLSSHILSEVERLCHRVIIIARGAICADDTPDALLSAHAASARYRIECAGPDAERLMQAIRAVPGVKQATQDVPSDPTWRALSIEPHQGAPDLRETLARTARSVDVLIRELHRPAPTLEAVFAARIAAATERSA